MIQLFNKEEKGITQFFSYKYNVFNNIIYDYIYFRYKYLLFWFWIAYIYESIDSILKVLL